MNGIITVELRSLVEADEVDTVVVAFTECKQLAHGAGMGYSAMAASGLEYFTFEHGYRAAAEGGYFERI